MELNSANPSFEQPNISDRQRFYMNAKANGVVNPEEMKRKIAANPHSVSSNPSLTNPSNSKPNNKRPMEDSESSDEEMAIPTPMSFHKTFACDKCKVCDEFETNVPKGTVCANCGCDLIHHLVCLCSIH